jgi:hypothetical protein
MGAIDLSPPFAINPSRLSHAESGHRRGRAESIMKPLFLSLAATRVIGD